VIMRDPVSLSPGGISRRRRQTNPIRYYSSSFVPNPYFTPNLNDNDLFGYSVSSGTFKPGEIHFVAGGPRGANSTGKVNLQTAILTIDINVLVYNII